ncbi:MAG: MopE-related protein [Byssovorax sp.]
MGRTFRDDARGTAKQPGRRLRGVWLGALPVVVGLGGLGCVDASPRPDPVSTEVEGTTATAEQAVVAPTCVTVQRGVFGIVEDAQLARQVTKAPALDGEANTNYGALTTAAIGTVASKESRRTLLRFDLSFIPPGSTINSATVTLKTTNTGPGTVELRRVTEFWDETRVTYNTWKNAQDIINPAVSFVSNPPAAAGLRSFDFPVLVQDWVNGTFPNYGVVLLEEGGKATTITTSEGASQAERPKLVVCYTPGDADGDGVAAPADCDDSDPNIHPGASETCNGLDDNCDGTVDEGDPGGGAACGTGMPGACASGTLHCHVGTVSCQPTNPPSAEICDGLDNDCNGQIDDNAASAPTWYADSDGDGFGSPASTLKSCAQPAGYLAVAGDCNDQNADVHPGAAELCNGADDNCNGSNDEGNPGGGMACATGQPGVCAAGLTACVGGGLVCNQSLQPTAEICDGKDNNCNGSVDEGSADADTWYRDADNDGHGDATVSVQACAQPMGYVLSHDDCNDADANVYPGANGSCGGHGASALVSGGMTAHSPGYSGVFTLGQSPGGVKASSPSYRFHGGLVGATQGQ